VEIGKNVRDARKKAQLSQEALARQAGISVSAVAQIEQGERTDPHYSTLSKLAKGLGISVGELLDSPKVEAPTSATSLEVTDEDRRYLNSLLLDSHTRLLSKRAKDTGGRIASLSRDLPPHMAFAVYQWVAQFLHECESYEKTLYTAGVMEYAHSVLERADKGEHATVELLDKVRDFHEAYDQLFSGIELEALDWVRDQFRRPEVVEFSNKERREYEKRLARTDTTDNVFLWEDFSRRRKAKEEEKEKASSPGSRLEGAG
jgi:transcriptional regulator with XRE-family HTH domain